MSNDKDQLRAECHCDHWTTAFDSGATEQFCGRARRIAERERGEPGRAEPTGGRLRPSAGSPEPETEDKTCDQTQGGERDPQTGRQSRCSKDGINYF